MKYSSVKVKVDCSNGSRFVSLLIANDIKVNNVELSETGAILIINDNDYIKLVSIADELAFKVKIISNYGIKGIIKKSLISLPYVVTLCVTIIMGFIGSLFVYDVRVITANGNSNYAVEKILVDNGIVGVMSKISIDKKHLEQIVLDNIPEVNFVTVYIDGISLCVNVVQSELPDSSGSHDTLVSTTEGIVSRVMVRSGTPLVKEGDRVSVGDELIAGYHICDNTPTDDIEEGEKVPCEADGEVYGTVYHHKRIVIPEKTLYIQYTGNKKTYTELFLGNMRVGKAHSVPFNQYQVARSEEKTYNLLPFKYVTYTYYEYKQVVLEKSIYIEKVLSDINKEISSEMPAGARIISSHHELKGVSTGEVLDVFYEVEQRLDNGGFDY